MKRLTGIGARNSFSKVKTWLLERNENLDQLARIGWGEQSEPQHLQSL
jgi:hypothetical protein